MFAESDEAFDLLPESHDPLPGQKIIDQQCHNDAHRRIEDAVEGVEDVGLDLPSTLVSLLLLLSGRPPPTSS